MPRKKIKRLLEKAERQRKNAQTYLTKLGNTLKAIEAEVAKADARKPAKPAKKKARKKK